MAVTQLPPTRPVSLSDNNSQQGKQNKQSHEEKSFDVVLKEKAEPERQTDINYKMSGYTKDAMAFYTLYQTREYTYSSLAK